MNLSKGMYKEIIEGIRNYRFLIIFMTFMFVAISIPIMNKFVLPNVMKSQFPHLSEEAIMIMTQATHIDSIRGYLENILSLGVIVTVFVLCGLVAQEIKEKTWIFPVSVGRNYFQLVMAKLIVYGLTLLIISTFSSMVSYLYSGVVFGFQFNHPIPVLRAGLLQGIYLVYLIGLIMLIGAITKKPIVTGLLVLIISYGTLFIGNIFSIDRYLPTALIREGGTLAIVPATSIFTSGIATIAILVVSVGTTIILLNKAELTKG